MATEGVEGCEGRVLPPPLPSAGAEDEERYRSPRMTASAWMTVLPPRMMCCVPWIWERREILLPVSYEPVAAVRLGLEGLKVLNGREGGEGCVQFRCTRPWLVWEAFWQFPVRVGQLLED